METKDYEKAVLGTESTATSINFGTLSTHAVLGLIAKTASIVDAAKKATFYKGYKIDEEAFKQACVELMNCSGYLIDAIENGRLLDPNDVADVDLPPEMNGLNLANLNVRLLHVTYGINSESGEIADALTAAWETGQPVDRVNLSEELGDVFWYLGADADALKVPFSVLFQQNITKLNDKKNGRYRKGGFNVDEAIHRDLTAERANLALSVGEQPIRHAGEISDAQAAGLSDKIEANNGAWGVDSKTGAVHLNAAVIDDATITGKLKGYAGQALDKVSDGVDAAKDFLKK